MRAAVGILRRLFTNFQGNGAKTEARGRRRLHEPPSRDDVIQAFQFILGREPENELVIQAHLNASSVSELRQTLLRSHEFTNKYRTMQPEVGAHPNSNRSRRAVLFIHLQKTGGTSLRELIGEQFPPDRRCPILEDKLHVLTLAELSRYDFFAGHFDISSASYIPRDVIDTVSLFREPQARLVSFYRFLKSHPVGDEFSGDQLIPLAHALTPEQFFERPELRTFSAVNNHYLFALGRSFSWFDQHRSSLSKKLLSAILMDAKLNISALTALGITEEFKESAKFICARLGLNPTKSEEALHVTDNFARVDTRFRRVEPVMMTNRLAEAIKDLVEYDNILYQYAVAEFRRRRGIAKAGGDRVAENSSTPV